MPAPKSKGKAAKEGIAGSREAKRLASVILAVLSGERGPQEGSEGLGISLNRYYQLERRALAGMIAGLEPKPKGRQASPERRLAELEASKARLEKELKRQQSLLRAAQRSLGVRPTKKSDKIGGAGRKKKTRRRGVVRGMKLAATLGAESSFSPDLSVPGAPPKEVNDGSSS